MASSINADNGVVSGTSGLKSTADTSGVLALQSNGSTGVTLDTSLNVGIGTSSPATKLEVSNGTIRASNTLGYYTNLTATGLTNFATTMDFDSVGSYLFKIASSEQMRLTSTGLGIGTSSPSTKLAVAGGISGTAGANISGAGWGVLPYVANSLVLDNNAGESRFFATGADATTDGSFLFYTGQTDGGANERFRIGTAGQLGIAGANYGTSGQVLTSGGSGAAPTWATPSSAMTLISTQTAANSATLTWTGLSGYNRYVILFNNLLSSGTPATLNIQFGKGATPTYIAASYAQQTLRSNSTTTTSTGTTGATNGLFASYGSATTLQFSGSAVLNGFTSLGAVSCITNWTQTTTNAIIFGFDSTNVPSGGVAITAIKLNFATGNITSGTASLYGISS